MASTDFLGCQQHLYFFLVTTFGFLSRNKNRTNRFVHYSSALSSTMASLPCPCGMDPIKPILKFTKLKARMFSSCVLRDVRRECICCFKSSRYLHSLSCRKLNNALQPKTSFYFHSINNFQIPSSVTKKVGRSNFYVSIFAASVTKFRYRFLISDD